MRHLSKEREKIILFKFLIYAVLSQFKICCGLLAFSLPLTWSSSILHSPPLPLKPMLTLCHPLVHCTVDLFHLINCISFKLTLIFLYTLIFSSCISSLQSCHLNICVSTLRTISPLPCTCVDQPL